MRAKHIFLPMAAAVLLGSYAIYSNAQRAKFDSELWKQAHYADEERNRAKLLSPLMVHVLKFGMTVDEVDQLLGKPYEIRGPYPYDGLGVPDLTYVYLVKQENGEAMNLTLDFSHKKKLTSFYIGEKSPPILF